jgi:hypothetical protein
LFVRSKRIEKIIQKELGKKDDCDIPVPENLASRVKKYLTKNRARRWDHAVAAIAADAKSEKAAP